MLEKDQNVWRIITLSLQILNLVVFAVFFITRIIRNVLLNESILILSILVIL